MTEIESVVISRPTHSPAIHRATVGRVWIVMKDLRPKKPPPRRSTRTLGLGVTSEGPSRQRVARGDSLRRFLCAMTADVHVDAYHTWTVSPGGAAIAAAACVEVHFQHSPSLPFDLLGSLPQPPEVKMSLIGRRVRELLDHLRGRQSTGTHSDAKSRSARYFPVPRSNLRRSAPRRSWSREAEHV